jgi:hypothetical protein
MKVYRIQVDVNHYQSLFTEREEDQLKLLMDCTPKLSTWAPPPVFVYEPKLQAGDFYGSPPCTLITNPHATMMIGKYLEMAGELLPLPYQDQVMTVLNVTECINCLNPHESTWLTDDEGVKLYPTTYVFYPNRFSESRIFKIPETYGAEILVVELQEDGVDEFRYAVERAGLKGLLFKELWRA